MADDIKEAVGVLLNCTSSEETTKLWEENSRLRTELEDIKRELVDQRVNWQLRRPSAIVSAPVVPLPLLAPSPVPQPAPAPALSAYADIQGIVCSINARLQVLESKFLRPPIASDRRRNEEPAKSGPVSAAEKSKGVKMPSGMLKSPRRACSPPGRPRLQ